MPWSYVALSDFFDRVELRDPSKEQEAYMRSVLESVSRQIDRYTERRFQPYTATRYFTATNSMRLNVPDLLTVTTLKTDADNDGTYEDTWTVDDDYYLLPYDAADDLEPYTRIEVTDLASADYTFPTTKRSVEIDGVWGYWLDTVDTGANVNEAYDASDLTLTVDIGENIKPLQTLLIETEQLYVTGKSSQDAITLLARGANGTTAATHASTTDISVYRYPEPVVEATFIQALRIWNRRNNPFGVAGGEGTGEVRSVAGLDRDVKDFLMPYRRLEIAFA